MDTTLEQMLEQAVASHRGGDLTEAERVYRRILDFHPFHPDANHNLGVLAVSVNRIAEGLLFLNLALEAKPSVEQFWISYISALLRVEQVEKAHLMIASAENRGFASSQLSELAIKSQFGGRSGDSVTPHRPKPIAVGSRDLTRKKNRKLSKTGVDGLNSVNERTKLLMKHFNGGRLDDAVHLAESIILEFSQNRIVWKILGESLGRIGRLEEFESVAQTATRLFPDDAELHFNHAMALQALERIIEAEISFTRAIELRADYAEAYLRLGNLFQLRGRFVEAVDVYSTAITLKLSTDDLYYQLGYVQRKLERLDDAEATLLHAIDFENYSGAAVHIELGNVFLEQGRYQESISEFKQGLAFENQDLDISNELHFFEAYHQMGFAFYKLGQFASTICSCKQALVYRPNSAATHDLMGEALNRQGMIGEAIESYETGLLFEPNNAEIHFNLSSACMADGQLSKGLAHYEWRFWRRNPVAREPRKNLAWDGTASLVGKKFLVYEEQGLGDTLQYCRYLILLEEKGADVAFKVTPRLHWLLRKLSSEISLIDSLPDDIEIDFEAPLMSLPYLFHTSLETVPSFSSYLHVDRDRVALWRDRVSTSKFKIGICWQGGKSLIDEGRSMHLSFFKDIANVPNVELISLHKGEGEDQISDINFSLTTFGVDFDNGADAFIDTAAVMMSCDLIITSDTAIAHLGGALGCRTWVALQHIPCWRWMHQRFDSPWYPAISLYRQNQAGNWDNVFDRLLQDLRKLLAKQGINT